MKRYIAAIITTSIVVWSGMNDHTMNLIVWSAITGYLMHTEGVRFVEWIMKDKETI